MSVVYPWVLGATLVAVAGIIAAHLLSVRRPPELMLPTVMFLDDRKVRAVARATRPSDRWLLLMRIAALMLAGLALAGMTWTGGRAATVSIVVLDARDNAAAGDSLAWRRAIERAMRATGTESLPAMVVWSNGRVKQFDPGAAWDSVWPSNSGSLASALIAARRAAPLLAMHADSIALHLVSPLREDVTSAALDAVRDAWPGRIGMVAVVSDSGRGADDAAADSLNTRGAGMRSRANVRSDVRDDVVAAAFARWGGDASTPARIVRGAISADDSAFAESGGAIVHWPVERAGDAESDRLPAVVANGIVLIGAGIERLSSIDSMGPAIAWWADGSPAATEQAYGAGCIRTVAFTAPGGDALLDASARGVLAALAAPCGARGALAQPARLTERQVTHLTGAGPLAAAGPFRAQASTSPTARWLLLAALVLLVAEMIVRSRPATAA